MKFTIELKIVFHFLTDNTKIKSINILLVLLTIKMYFSKKYGNAKHLNRFYQYYALLIDFGIWNVDEKVFHINRYRPYNK